MHIEPCEDCPLRASRSRLRCVGSRGPVDASFVAVGEAPGSTELSRGEPMIGPSGQLFESVLHKAGFDEGAGDRVLITNALACRPPAEIQQSYIKACHRRLESDLLASKRTMILLLGRSALRSVTGRMGAKITAERGKLIKTAYGPAIPTFHPASVLRTPGQYRYLLDDIRYAISIVQGAPLKSPGKVTYFVADKRSIDGIVNRLLKYRLLAVDIETSHLNPRTERILCVGFAWAKNHSIIIPGEFVNKLKPLFESNDITFVWHNGKYDTSFLNEAGIFARVDQDTMLMSYALSETGSHALKDVAADLLGADDWKQQTKPYLARGGTFEDIPNEVLYPYLAEDCDNTFQIYHILNERLNEPAERGPRWAYDNILIPASNFLRGIEHHGMMVDTQYIDELEHILQTSIESSRARLFELAGHEFNPQSPKQLLPLLHTRGIRVTSTDRKHLSGYSGDEFVSSQLAFRKESKALGTYVHGMKRRIEADGRVHSTYGLTSTVTGRLSSTNPNLQNITSRAGDPDNRIKRLFVAPPGRVLIECDYSQAELRMLAVLSEDEFLHSVYVNGRDLHTEVATALFGPDFTPGQRVFAKTINFGIVYGLQAPGLSAQIGCSQVEAQRMIDGWFSRAPQAHEYLMRLRSKVRTRGYVQSPFGRKRRFPIVTAEIAHSLENEACNHPISSAASDLTLISAMEMQPYLAQRNAYTINLVHDSNVIEAPEEVADDVARYAVSVMQGIPADLLKSSITFVADCKAGRNWAQMTTLKIS